MTWWWPASPQEAARFLNLMLLLMFTAGPAASAIAALIAWRLGWLAQPGGAEDAPDAQENWDQERSLRKRQKEMDKWRK